MRKLYAAFVATLLTPFIAVGMSLGIWLEIYEDMK